MSVNGRNVPNYVQSEGNAKFRVNFKPQEAAPHNLSVRFNGEPVPGSPFLCKVLGSNQIIVTGPALKMTPIGQPSCLFIDPQVRKNIIMFAHLILFCCLYLQLRSKFLFRAQASMHTVRFLYKLQVEKFYL